MIEMVMVLVLIGIMSAAGFGYLSDNSRLYRLLMGESAMYAELWSAMERISRDTHGCSGLDVSIDSPTQVTLVNPKKGSCANCADQSQTIVYRLNGGNLERSGGIGNFYPIARNVSIPTGETAIFEKLLQEKLVIRLTKTEDGAFLTIRSVVRMRVNSAEEVL